MMQLQERINAFVKLGAFLREFANTVEIKNQSLMGESLLFEDFKKQLKLAELHNAWFTPSNLLFAIDHWGGLLTEKNLSNWLAKYHFEAKPSKQIAIIMAGNIPLVGFHDFLSALISGHRVLVKTASNDKHLLPFLTAYLTTVEPRFKESIEFTEGSIKKFDAVIATGSNNTARYFESYFKNTPAIIRKNRNSVAVLTGRETPEMLRALSEDIFRYYGLGCRSVSKLFVPKDYDFNRLFESLYHWHPIIEHKKYANNYDYNKAVYLMSLFDILENGFLMLKEDPNYASPIATLFYEYYDDLETLNMKLERDQDQIQCVVSKGFCNHEIALGTTQTPVLDDYADGVDVITFLNNI